MSIPDRKETSDGGCIIAGVVHPGDSSWGDAASCLIKMDKNGNIIWELQRGSGNWDQTDSVIETNDGNIEKYSKLLFPYWNCQYDFYI